MNHSVIPDRDTDTTRASVVVAIDEEEAELVGPVGDITEGWVNTVLGAEVDPVPEGAGLGA